MPGTQSRAPFPFSCQSIHPGGLARPPCQIADAAKAGDVRGDAGPDELASYCLHALAAAGELPSRAAVRRLVAVTLSRLRPPR